MKYVLFYESADDVMSTAPEHFSAHQAHYTAFHDQGTLLLLGTFGDPQAEGSMGVFSTQEAAEQFAAEDPFVRNGVVRSYSIRTWNEVLTTE